MKKIVIDTSVIDSIYESFRKVAKGNIMILSNLTFEELQDREKDQNCTLTAKVFAKKIIKYFAEPWIDDVDYKTDIIKLEKESSHVDHTLVMWASKNDASIYTGDYGMVLDCRFNNVPVIWAEHSVVVRLPYVEKKDDGLQIDLSYVPFRVSVFVLDKNMEPVRYEDDNIIHLIDEDQILEYQPDEEGYAHLTIYNIKPGTNSIVKVGEKYPMDFDPREQRYEEKWKRRTKIK